MKHISTLAVAALLSVPSVIAQTSDLVFFSDDGAKFTLVIDGDVKNDTPASRVVATGIRTESPMVVINFADAGIPPLKKPGYFPLGMEYTTMITTNKKGERVLRPTGQAALGTAAAAEPVKPKPATFTEDPAPAPNTTNSTGINQTTTVGGVDQVTTVTTVEETSDDGMGMDENVNMNMSVNGVGISMNVGVTDGTTGTTGATTTSHTTTTTTTTRTTSSSGGTMTTANSGTLTTAHPEPVKPTEPEVYHMPGYSGPIGCGWPMSASEFAEAKSSIESKGFEETKMTMAKQIGRDRCFTVEQVKGVMSTFGFEDTKLEFAKFAYDRTYDIGNYYKVNDAFSFETSVEELNNYIQSR